MNLNKYLHNNKVRFISQTRIRFPTGASLFYIGRVVYLDMKDISDFNPANLRKDHIADTFKGGPGSGKKNHHTGKSNIEGLAKKHFNIDSLKVQNSDSKDFHNVAVWDVKSALKEAGAKSDAHAEKIAKEHLGINSLKTQNSDSHDFHDVSVTGIKNVLHAATNIHKANGTKSFSDVIVVNRDGYILLLKRNKLDAFGPSTYSLPGGTIEEGEDEYQCASRELQEETAIECTDQPLAYITKIDNGKGSSTCYFFLPLPPNAVVTINNQEHESYIWADKEAVLQLPLLLDLKERLIQLLSAWFVS